MSYNSKTDTLEHIKTVAKYLSLVSTELLRRASCHDESKLHEPEKSYFDKYTPKLKEVSYGTEEYKACLKELSVALKHHYENNSHHPEHYENGVDGMDLLDVIEMFVDWKAASERHADGDIISSINKNEKRFSMSPQLVSIFKNTVKYFDEWCK